MHPIMTPIPIGFFAQTIDTSPLDVWNVKFRLLRLAIVICGVNLTYSFIVYPKTG